MSKKTNIEKKPIIKDFGIQPYRKCDKDYPEVIRTPTFKAANDATVVRESEFAKPYDESEDYSGMEYGAPNWPGFNYPGMDYPDMGLPVPDFPNMYDPWKMYFRCSVDPCWCEGETKTFAANCTYEIVDAKFIPSESDLSVTFTKNTISITALNGIREGESGNLTITMLARVPKGGTLWQGKYDPVYGRHGGISVSECGDLECCDDSAMAWDDAGSGDTIVREGTCNLAITDNGTAGAPYDWSVTGTGYWFDQAYSITSLQTSAKQVTLYADNTACGAASIIVNGCGANSVSGEVRGTIGQWIRRYCRTGIECPGCGWPCAKGSLGGTGCTDWGGARCCLQNGGTAEGAPYGPNEEIVGKIKFWHYWKCQNGFGSDTCCCGITDAVSNRCNTCLPLATRYMGSFWEWIC
jgi:hypothetical protein